MTQDRAQRTAISSWTEKVGRPVCSTNEQIPHADTELRIRRRNAIGADHNPGDSTTHSLAAGESSQAATQTHV